MQSAIEVSRGFVAPRSPLLKQAQVIGGKGLHILITGIVGGLLRRPPGLFRQVEILGFCLQLTTKHIDLREKHGKCRDGGHGPSFLKQRHRLAGERLAEAPVQFGQKHTAADLSARKFSPAFQIAFDETSCAAKVGLLQQDLGFQQAKCPVPFAVGAVTPKCTGPAALRKALIERSLTELRKGALVARLGRHMVGLARTENKQNASDQPDPQ